MPGPCSGKNLISILVTDYIQKRRGEPGHFSFEYNMSHTKIYIKFLPLHGPGIKQESSLLKMVQSKNKYT